ncbi:MAG: tRNA uridine-5-carboxymethylaminomethyl(34) synthesis GTPase MnmE [Lachnospiraceae bacterium]|nr:tRNA uridine-5-carboxymethylaminomethyl(34) synthesis GTPase MnmE [Lachnospiraceae bacterium]
MDTIAAICTALSPSGIGIIRISGEEAITIADKIFKGADKKKLKESDSHTIHYGHIVDGNEIVDEVLVMLMKAPRSYTMEDVVEIDCHGGILVLKKVFNLLIENGCRPSEPGEFTKRAFLNGRIDLTSAEAVMDLISSKSEMARKNSVSMLNGKMYELIKNLREEILYYIAKIEAALDDPEHMSLDGFEEELQEKINNIQEKINQLIKSYDSGKILKEGINTAIVGKPNAGKSSILNMILNEERAIVTEIKGTTRDTLEESYDIGGITLNLIDTAGIHESDDVVEKIGIERAKSAIEKADLVLYVADSSTETDVFDDQIISLIDGKKSICLLNKSDLQRETTKQELNAHFEGCLIKPVILYTSAKNGEGKEELFEMIKEMFFAGEISFNDEIMVSNLRQKNDLVIASDSLKKVSESIENSMPEDFLSIDLMSAYAALGEIIGEEVSDDLVDKIFSEFCMGK